MVEDLYKEEAGSQSDTKKAPTNVGCIHVPMVLVNTKWVNWLHALFC